MHLARFFSPKSARITDGIRLARFTARLNVYMPKPTRFAAAVAGMALLLGATLVSARQDPVTASAPRVIEVVAKRFTFEPSTIEVTEGENIRLMVRSADGIHGIEIKKFKVNKVVPRGGEPVPIDFVASAPGTYEIACSEHCGDGHESMTGTLVVQAKPRSR
jgi:cytochrome c oxidase subunit II